MFPNQELKGDELQRAIYQVKKAKPLRDLTIYEVSRVTKYIFCCCDCSKKKESKHGEDHVDKYNHKIKPSIVELNDLHA